MQTPLTDVKCPHHSFSSSACFALTAYTLPLSPTQVPGHEMWQKRQLLAAAMNGIFSKRITFSISSTTSYWLKSFFLGGGVFLCLMNHPSWMSIYGNNLCGTMEKKCVFRIALAIPPSLFFVYSVLRSCV